MSNAKTSPDAAYEPSSRWPSQSPQASDGGATPTPYGSSIPCCTPASSGQALSSGAPAPNRTQPDGFSLATHVAGPGYLERLWSVAERVAGAPDPAAVQSLLVEGIAAVGAENALFISFVRDDVQVSSCRFMLACDPAWCREYLAAGLIEHDPWLSYACHHSEPLLADDLCLTDPSQQRAIELAAKSGFASAVLVPVHSGTSHTRVSLLCIGSEQAGFFDGVPLARLKVAARVLACEVHEWWLARLRNDLVARARITESDLALLRHETLGHGSKRIAAELGVSQSSINSRFQRMNSRLGVPNRKLAARLAAESGLILP